MRRGHKDRSSQSLQSMEHRCGVFNRKHPVGTQIRVWTGLMNDGPGRIATIVEPGARVLGGHTAVVQISGGGACVCLTHTKPLTSVELEESHAAHPSHEGAEARHG